VQLLEKKAPNKREMVSERLSGVSAHQHLRCHGHAKESETDFPARETTFVKRRGRNSRPKEERKMETWIVDTTSKLRKKKGKDK